MRYVIAVAEMNSFTRAAQRCMVVQSALSHQIARLEKELGARLFERTSHRVRLTPAGAAFLGLLGIEEERTGSFPDRMVQEDARVDAEADVGHARQRHRPPPRS